jgi:hypothetical protein
MLVLVNGIGAQFPLLGRVDGFDQERDERAVILRRLLASKCDTLEALELADRLFDACPCLVECFRKEGGHILGVGSRRKRNLPRKRQHPQPRAYQ